MRVDGHLNPAALWFKTVEKNPAAGLDTLVDQGAIGKAAPAKPAAANTSFPTQAPLKLDSASILALQQAELPAGEESKPEGVSAADEFLAYMQKTPEERLRESILKSLGLTEEDLESLPPEQRQAIEEKIKEMIKERITPASELGFEGLESTGRQPGALAASLSNGLSADLLAAAGYKPKE